MPFVLRNPVPFVRACLVLCLSMLLPTAVCAGRPFYDPGDWVSYTNLSFVTSIAGDDETVYVGTTGGVARYDRYADQWRTPLTVSDGLLDNQVKDVLIDPNTNDVWFKTDAGYSVLWPKSDTWSEALFPPEFQGEGGSDLGSLPDLLMPFGYAFSAEGYITDPVLRRYPVTDYWADNWGNLWVGTWGLGVGKADLRTRRLEMHPLGLKQDNVNAVAISGNRLWFGGTDQGGITLYDRGAQTWRYFEAGFIPRLKSDQVLAIVPGDRYVWFGTTYGLSRYDPPQDAWLTYTVFDTLQADEVTALEKDGDALWIGTVSGVSRLIMKTGKKENVHEPSLKFRRVNSIAASGGYVWVATVAGVFRYEHATGLWDRFDAGESSLVGEVRAVSTVGSEVWFASPLGVVCFDTGTGRSESYPALIFLDNNEPGCLAASRKAVWVGTSQGVWKLDRGRGEWVRFDQIDFLVDNRVQAIALDGDYVWFGTRRGVTRFFWNSPHRFD